MRRRSLVLRSIYAACLLGAGLNHALILLRHGLWWDYGGMPWPSSAYWTSLTLLDPLVALLLFVRPRVGVACTAVLMASNMAHNLAVTAWWAAPGAFAQAVLGSWQLLSQIGFALFVAATVRMAWAGAPAQATA